MRQSNAATHGCRYDAWNANGNEGEPHTATCAKVPRGDTLATHCARAGALGEERERCIHPWAAVEGWTRAITSNKRAAEERL